MVFLVIAAAAAIGSFYAISQVADWIPYISWLVAWGAVTFVLYGWDKAQSKSSGWRVPEVVLHSMALAGGVAGAWLGMFLFRHKTQKPEFKLVLVFAAILHAVILSSLMSG
jgi:uncharacterized membrane protein YsdA (DUF1294 family)